MSKLMDAAVTQASSLVPDLGQLRSIHQSSSHPLRTVAFLVLWLLVSAVGIGAGIAMFVYRTTNPEESTGIGIATRDREPVVWLGIVAFVIGVGALLALLVSVLDLVGRAWRDWLATYEAGFAYGIGSNVTVVRWSDVANVAFQVDNDGRVNSKITTADGKSFEPAGRFTDLHLFNTAAAQLRDRASMPLRVHFTMRAAERKSHLDERLGGLSLPHRGAPPPVHIRCGRRSGGIERNRRWN